MSRLRGGKVKEYTQPKIKQPKISKSRKPIVTALILFSIFALVLFLTTYFNFTNGSAFNPDGTTLGTRFFLGGPDPYLNMRQAEITMETGTYPFTQPHSGDADPLLNYPVGERGSRPPLFTLVAVGFAHVLNLFMNSIDALGFAMLFLPAIYGALLVFPVYGIARTLFNRKIGILAAFLVVIIPIHIGGSHGASLALFDHDSFVLLLFACLYFFIIKMLKEPKKSTSLLYGGLAGTVIGAIYMTWAASQLAFMLPLVGMFIIMVFDIFKSKTDTKNIFSFILMFVLAYVISIPYAIIQGQVFDLPFIVMLASLAILGIYLVINKLKIPWIISVPSLVAIGSVGLSVLYLGTLGYIKLQGFLLQLAINVFGEGIYGSKVSMTVAEAHTFGISQNIMSFGPVLYWMALCGFVVYIVKTYKEKLKTENIFFSYLFILAFFLTTTSGRFLNDLIPTFTIFSAFFIMLLMDRVDLRSMIKSMRSMSGFRKRKAIKIYHIFGILFIVLGLMIPNTLLALDASVPPEAKEKYFGQGWSGAFGMSVSKEVYWADAFYWLSQQDTEIANDSDKPAFISWWDYGFYEAAMGKHPTVADNYQVGMYASGNFKLSTTEQEAVSVLIVRCCEGAKSHNNGKLPETVKTVFDKYMPLIYSYQTSNETNATVYQTTTLPNNTTFYNLSTIQSSNTLVQYIEDPTTCPTYNTLDSPQYGNTVFRKRADNAMYHDSWQLMKDLTDEQITNFYKDIQEATGYSIRYYGTEQYDTQIFGVFTFLTDRGVQGFGPELYEDDYYIMKWKDMKTNETYFAFQLEKFSQQEFEQMDLQPYTDVKDLVYDTMWYKTYWGYGRFPDNRMPTYLLTHFKLAYFSPIVVISKYYEGATITGNVKLETNAFPYVFAYVFDEYGIPHGYGMTDENGNFSLIAPAGNLTVQLFTTTNPLNMSIPITISEEEGQRKVGCNKSIPFIVNTAVFNINITNSGHTNYTSFVLKVEGQEYGQEQSYPFSLSQNFQLTNLIPQTYKITVTVGVNNTQIYSQETFVKPGANTFDVTI